MNKYTTNFSRGCFHHWSKSKGVMELVQNWLDSDGEREYEIGEDCITLTNKNIKVSNKMLMMGMSDKRTDPTKRGCFGVGSIQAMVVLTDTGVGVDIHNNDVCWSPKFEHCDKFNEDIMVIEETPCSNGKDFTVLITGLSEEDIDEVKQRCLHFQDRQVLHSTPLGDIIDNSTGEGEVFVGDMYVCQNHSFKYSYNFKPKVVKLSQDRDAVSQWDLQQVTAKLIIATEDNTFIKEAIKANTSDTSRINTQWSDEPNTNDDLDNELAEEFLQEHGTKLVTSDYTVHQTNEKLGNPSVYIQNERQVNSIKNSSVYQTAICSLSVEKRENFTDLMWLLLDYLEYKSHYLPDEDTEEGGKLHKILEEVRDRVDNQDYE